MNQRFFTIIFHVFVRILSVFGSFLCFNVISNHLGTADYGYWSQVTSTANLLIPLILMQLPLSFLRFYNSKTVSSKNKMGTILVLTNIVMAIVFLVFSSLEEQLAKLIFGNENFTHYIDLLLLYIFFKINFQLLLSYFRASGNPNVFSKLLLIESILQIALLLLFVLVLQLGFSSAVYSYVVVDGIIVICILIWMIFVNKNLTLPTFKDWKALSHFLLYSLPLVPQMFLFWIVNLSDRYILLYFHGIETASIYSATYLLGSLFIMSQVALNFIVLPESIFFWENNKKVKSIKYLGAFQNYYFLSGLFLVGLLVLIGSIILQTIGTSDFVVSELSIFMITFGCLLFGTEQFIRNVFHLYKNTKILPIIFGVSALLNIMLNLILIPVYRIEGAALATLITFAVQFVIFTYFQKRMTLESLNFVLTFKITLMITIGIICLKFNPFKEHELIINTITISILYLIAIKLNWLNLNELKYFLIKGKNKS